MALRLAPRVWCGSCSDLERGLRARPGERMGRWSPGRGWVCPRCGSADVRVLDGWLSRWWSRIWRLLVWGTALAALVYATKP